MNDNDLSIHLRSLALRKLCPNGYSARGDEVTPISDPTPTQSEIDAEVEKQKTEYDAKQYQRDRQYPAIGEQLDMLFHDMTAGKGNKNGEWYKAVKKVKTDNPKP